jgi:hypothetical protein
VGDLGAVALAGALEKNTTLHTLDLGGREFVVLWFVRGGGLIVIYGVWVVVGYVVGVEGRVRGVDCVCATESPCSSVNGVYAAGWAALAAALEKNTTLHTLDISSEFVVLWFCFWRGAWLRVMFCGLLLVMWLVWRGLCAVLIVRAPLNRRVHQTSTDLPPLKQPSILSSCAIVRFDLSCTRAPSPPSLPLLFVSQLFAESPSQCCCCCSSSHGACFVYFT